MKIALITESVVSAGGAERVLSIMANYWADKNWEVHFYSFDFDDAKSFYSLHQEVNWHNLGKLFGFPGRFIKRVFFLSRHLKKIQPDIVISFMDITNIMSVLASKIAFKPIIISDRNHPKFKKLKWWWEVLRNLTYPLAKKVVFLTESQIACYPKIIQRKSLSIKNPIIVDKSQVRSQLICEGPFILSVGRLRWQKGHDILIKSFSKVAQNYPDLKLVILGEGILREKLEKLISSLGLQEKVFLPSILNNVHDYLKKCEVFIFPSRWEGLGHSLVEALSYGCASIASDCDYGPRELIKDGDNGLLFKNENISDLSEKIIKVLNDQAFAQKIKSQARQLEETFSVSKIMEKWETIITQSLSEKKD